MPFDKKGFLGEAAKGFVKSSFSSAIKLLEIGLSQDAGTILRSMVESTIFLTACGRSKDFVNDYHFASEKFRLKLANISLQGEDGAIECTAESKPKLEAVKTHVEKLIAEGKVKELKVDKIAKDVGLQGVYNTGYRLLSNNHAHSGSASLQQYFRFGKEGEIEAILWEPQMKGVEHLMFTVCSCMTHSFGVVTDVFNIPGHVTSRLEKRVDAAMAKLKEHLPANQSADVELRIK